MKKQDLIDEIIEIVLENAEEVNESRIDYKLDQLLTDDVINFVHSSLLLKEKERLNFEEWKTKYFIKTDNYKYISKKTNRTYIKFDLIKGYEWYKENL